LSYAIRVQSVSGGIDLLQKIYDSDIQWNADVELCVSKPRIGWFKALLIPVRTDSLKKFCKDFFLPGFFNHALKTHDFALKVFQCLLMPIFDLITLPIRLITVIPRYLYNAKQPKQAHLFYRFLINNGVPANALDDNHVYVEVARMGGPVDVMGKKYKEHFVLQGKTLNFIELPQYVSAVTQSTTAIPEPSIKQLQLLRFSQFIRQLQIEKS
jgi:hypothetical protein